MHGFLDAFHGGFLKSGHIGWQDSTAREWSRVVQENVCAVDWSRLATYEYALTALSHTRKVGEHIAEFVNVLVANGADIGQISIAGHSLGAQIAGYAGANLNGKIKAIYGLDPAGPAFYMAGPSRRLDPSDAKYVQCIHTARLTFGVNSNCGHADFYPNVGFMMPGCLGGVCSHLYAVRIFRSSLEPTHNFVGSHCAGDIEARWKRNDCSTTRESMGIRNKGVKGQFYLETTANEPYCKDCPAKRIDVPARATNAERKRSDNKSSAPGQIATQRKTRQIIPPITIPVTNTTGVLVPILSNVTKPITILPIDVSRGQSSAMA